MDTLEAKASSGTKSVNTVDNASGLMRKWVVPALGTWRLVDLTPEDVETVLAHMVADGKAPQDRFQGSQLSRPGSGCCRTPGEGFAEDRLRVGSVWRPSDLVFTTNIGTAINPNNLRRSFRALTGKAQLPGR